MFSRIKRLYDDSRLDMNGLISAVNKKLITEDQFFMIGGRMYDEITGNKAGEGKNAPIKEVPGNG